VAAVVANAENSHEHHEWQPENGWNGHFYCVANISLGVGFALLIGAGMCLRGVLATGARSVVGTGRLRSLFRCTFLGIAAGSSRH